MKLQTERRWFQLEGWTPTLDALPVRRALLIEPEAGQLWAIEARLNREWPDASVHHARNGVEGCLLAGRLEPDFIALSSELEHTKVCDLIEHFKRRDRGWRSVVVLSTTGGASDRLVRSALAANVDAVVPLSESQFGPLQAESDGCMAQRILLRSTLGSSRPTPLY